MQPINNNVGCMLSGLHNRKTPAVREREGCLFADYIYRLNAHCGESRDVFRNDHSAWSGFRFGKKCFCLPLCNTYCQHFVLSLDRGYK
ncbi:hypothetical protein CEXT_9441 [Caerostris extrusa]|uniref:Uncharacterized protein n=1 Tax=Caerostris extrusa TaxID=172846 RepID=A0AAV4NZB2_CAEEX|nr:hypothetical protein CEXT_9441 [Caerostris extrusa]